MPPVGQRLQYNNETHSERGWAIARGIHQTTLRRRRQAGWTLGQALGYEPPPPRPARPKKVRVARAQPAATARWCPTHALGYVPADAHGQPYWRPLRRELLAYASAIAEEWQCTLTIREARCPWCTEKETAPVQGYCDKCGKEREVASYAGGLLHVCDACKPSPTPCAAFAHLWRGAEGPVWVCWTCAARLDSQEIDVNRIVKAPDPQPLVN